MWSGADSLVAVGLVEQADSRDPRDPKDWGDPRDGETVTQHNYVVDAANWT